MLPLKFIKQILDEFGKDKVGQLSAAFSYIAIFSIGPLLLVMVSIMSFFFGKQAAEGTLFSRLSETVGPDTASTLQNAMTHTYHSQNGWLAFVIGTIGLLLGAAGISGQLQTSFDTIFSVVGDPKSGLKRTIYLKIKNILIVIMGGLAIAVSLFISTLILGLGSELQQNLNLPIVAIEVLNNLLSLIIFTLVIFVLYKTVPNIKVPPKILFPVALIVAVLFLAGKIVLGIIIAKNGAASAYGAAASLIVLLLWIYYSSQLVFIGAEGIKVYGENNEIIYEPKKYNLKRTTINLDHKGYTNKLLQSFLKGLKNKHK